MENLFLNQSALKQITNMPSQNNQMNPLEANKNSFFLKNVNNLDNSLPNSINKQIALETQPQKAIIYKP